MIVSEIPGEKKSKSIAFFDKEFFSNYKKKNGGEEKAIFWGGQEFFFLTVVGYFLNFTFCGRSFIGPELPHFFLSAFLSKEV